MSAHAADAVYQPVLDDGAVLGVRCHSCGRATAPRTPRCPACGSAVELARFAPTGTVWASSVIHIPVGERTPPYGLAYVDLDDGPRVLALQEQAITLAAGTRVRAEPSDDPQAWCVLIEEAQL